MKTGFHAPAVLSTFFRDPPAETARPGAVPFKPLSAPCFCEGRIEVATIDVAVTGRSRYPYKRADESVN